MGGERGVFQIKQQDSGSEAWQLTKVVGGEYLLGEWVFRAGSDNGLGREQGPEPGRAAVISAPRELLLEDIEERHDIAEAAVGR
jgi:hypothetical protein